MATPVRQIIDYSEDRFRVVSSARLREAVMLPVLAPGVTLDDLAELESATNPRLAPPLDGSLDINPAELAGDMVPGHSVINAAFTHPRPSGNRFNTSARGAWYAADEAQTCFAEVVYHLEDEFAAIDRWDAEVHYSVIHARISGRFVDLHGIPGNHMHPDKAIGYPAGQALANTLRAEGYDGVLYPSARRPGHDCVAVFTPGAISHFRLGEEYRLVWSGGPGPTYQRLI